MTLEKAMWLLVGGWLTNFVIFTHRAVTTKEQEIKEKATYASAANFGAALYLSIVLVISKIRGWK